jgi:hypothetical protein
MHLPPLAIYDNRIYIAYMIHNKLDIKPSSNWQQFISLDVKIYMVALLELSLS